MKNRDFARIESALGVALPADFKEVMLDRGDEARETAAEHPRLAEHLLLDRDEMIRRNLSEREPDAGTADAFPNWWKKLFLVGDNGAGDFYCLKLTGDGHVWMIGSDCGDKPTKKFESYAEFVDSAISSYVAPEPLPSSFDPATPLLQRFQVIIWEDRCKIRPLEGDRPLTSEKLAAHGIALADIQACVQAIIAGLASRRPEEVRILDKALPSDYGVLMIALAPPNPADARFAHLTIEIYGGYVGVTFRLASEQKKNSPAAKSLTVDWAAFQAGVTRLLNTLYPPGTRVSLTSPRADSGGEPPHYEWKYSLDYTLQPAKT
jgi:hypothetical protein